MNRPIIRGIYVMYNPLDSNNGFNYYALRLNLPLRSFRIMNRKQERELLVFTYLIDKGLRPVSEIQAEWGLTEDEDFQLENTINELANQGYLEQKSARNNGGPT